MALLTSLFGGLLGLLARDAARLTPPPSEAPAGPTPPPPMDPTAMYRALMDLGLTPGETDLTPFRLYSTREATPADQTRLFRPAAPMPGVVPESVRPMAMDDLNNPMANFGGSGYGAALTDGMYWLGFPYLAELAQRTEYRRISETIAKDMTRRWFRLQAKGQDDKSDRIAELEDAMKRHKLKEKFTLLALLDGFFGRSHLYIDNGQGDDRDLMKLPLPVDPRMIKKGDLKGIRVVEPMWCYPNNYNAADPLREGFYLPQTWWVMGKEIHRTRVLPFIGREMPDMLKPAYSFAGLALSQMAKPYVDNWLRTRQSVSDLVHSFSTPVLQTNMGAVLNSGAAATLAMRAQMFNYFRDNNNMMILDKTTEDFKNVATPLGAIDHLQAQSQEHMASAVGIPLVVLLGISPSGLNATSEGELQVWSQFIRAQQASFFDAHLVTVLNVLMLDLWGEIDDDITHAWEPLREMSEEEEATARKSDADLDAVYVNAGVLSPDEIRQKLAGASDSPYQGLDLTTPAPTPPEQEPDPLGGAGGPPGGGVPPSGSGGPPPDASGLSKPAGGSPAPIASGPGKLGPAGSPNPPDPNKGSRDGKPQTDDDKAAALPAGESHVKVVTQDPDAKVHVHLGEGDRGHVRLGADEFKEGDHPRGEGGKFGPGGNSVHPAGKERKFKAAHGASEGRNDPLTPEEKATAHAALEKLTERDHPWADTDEDRASYGRIIHPSDIGFGKPDTIVLGGAKNRSPKYGPVRDVPIHAINYGQPYVPKEGIKAYIENLNHNPELPEIGHNRDTGEHFVISGHTRLSAQALSGRPTTRARVYEFANRHTEMGGVKTLIPNSRYQVMPTAADTAQAADEWNESDHDRAKNGQFGAGGGGHTRNETSADDRPAMTEAGHRAKELVPDATHFTNPARAKAIGDGSHDFSKSSTRTWQGAGLYLFPGDHPGRDNFGEAKLRVKPDLRNPFIGNTADVEKKVDELKKTFQPPVFRLPDGSTISGPDGEPLRAYTDTAGPNADLREAWLKAGHDGIIETGGDGKAQTIAVFHPHSLGEIDGAGGGGGGGSAAPAPEGTEAATFTHDPGHEGWQFGSGVVPHKKSDIVEETPLPLAKLHSELKSNNYNAKPVQGVQDIPVRELHAWQGTIQPDKLRPLEPGYPPIEVAKLDGKYIIRNGNHRAVSGFVQGADTIKANLTDFDDPKNHKYRKAPPAAAKDALGGDDPDEADGETATAPVDDYVERVLAADAAEWKETDHPRDKSGKFGSGGGGGAATGGGETAPAAATERTREAATRVPDADKAWVARRGSAKAMKAYATKALEEGHDPAAAIAKIKDLAGKEVHGAVADYANQLIDHIAAAHGIDAHQHGRATKRDGGGGGTPEPAPPPPDPDAHRREQEARLHAHVSSFAATVPDAPEAWVAKRASARQMKALVTRALEEHSPPLETIAKLKQLAGGELHGKVEQYANQLIDHMGQAWQTDFSSHRAARRRQDAAPTPRPQPQPQPQPKPSPTPEPDKGKLPQKIGDVIKERGHKWIASEKDFHERSWAHATPELLGAMRNTLPLTRVKFEEGGRAHYNYPHEIKMDSLKDTGTWRHEYGHAIDWNGAGWGVGRNNASYRADGDRAREADTLMGQIRRWQFKKGAGQGLSYKTNAYDLADEAEKVGLTEDDLKAFAGPRLKAQQAIMEVLVHGDLAHVPDVQRDIDKSYTFEGRYDEVRAVDVDNSQFQDFIGAMTKERFGSGHGVAYYNKVPAFQTAEMFAQYVSLTSSANGKVYKKLLKAIAPKTTDHFDDILAERGGATIKKGA